MLTKMSRPPAKNSQSKAAPKQRPYHSLLRQQQAADTRERIIAAAAKLAHSSPTWDWKGLTFRAVGEGAGVTERTVHRHFSTERGLRDAVIQRLVMESGVQLDRIELSNFAAVTASVFAYLSSFEIAPESVKDPSMASIDQHRCKSLLDAVVRETPTWSEPEQKMAAAMFDMLWNVPSYERLVTAWRLDSKHATQAVTWVIGLVEEAIQQGRRPGTNAPRRAKRSAAKKA